jgi:AcrR family transcriptional regulator
MPTHRARHVRWERRPDDRPHELLDAALRGFAARGYRNTRLDEVAAAAGVSKGAVYHYFENKEELLLRALEQYQAQAFGRVEEALRAEHGGASTRLRLFFRKAFGGDDAARHDVLLLLQSVAHEVPGIYRRWLASGPVRGWEIVARLIDDGKAAGEFRADVDSEVAARLMLTGLTGQIVWRRYAADVPGLAIDLDRLIDSSLDLLLAGLRPVASVRSTRGL